MAVSVTLPALGESVTEGTVTRWLKAEGERVEADEPLLEVSTDKVDTEIPSPASGVLASIKVAEDETVEVGAELAVIDDGTGAPAAAPAPAAEPAPAPAPAAEPAPAQVAPSTEAAAPAPAPTAQAAAGASGAAGTDVVLPALGESVTEGTVTRWLKAVGESVEADEPLLEVSTDKVDTEIPSPVAGTLLEILVEEDGTAEVGARLAVIGAAGAAPAAAPAPAAPAPAPAAAPAAPAPAPVAPGPRAGRRRARSCGPGTCPGRPGPGHPRGSRSGRRSRRRGRVRDPAGPQARRGERREPRLRAGHGRRRADPQAGRPRRRRGREGRCRRRVQGGPGCRGRPEARARGVPAARPDGQDDPDAQGHRREHDEGPALAGAAHQRRRGGRHPRHAAARPGQGGVRRPRGRQAVADAVLRQGRGPGPQGAPGDQRQDQRGRGHDHLLRLREHRDRGGLREGSDDPGHQGCGRPEHRRYRQEDRGAGGQRPGQQDHPRRPGRCDLHHQQHRVARRAVRHRHRAAEPGRHPGYRRDRQAPGGRGDP
ncbi:hypothetical protein SBRY_20781 [Actinacidiphila bryophytorum]|uniref:Lipoyl-binding domain-containing protein n=2 Tax=Actinacidiphila bryophytorum TaxID=1436133 RepID=A0A9W4E815_9ACTN|nr:hypothetical protein SBRY_20781 [Actinacidiphila bryophytorum]